ncbi:hypothetical protein GQ53DRAFT_93426 [Thozetella sp. PMI_491]|nr:hypothetical protein GQ53DRAFT_93426 [Thozetella sp. PMI_491]
MGKRGRARHDAANSHDEEKGGSATAKSKQHGGAVCDERLLACPCYKYNPIRYLGCLLRNRLTDTAFVVQHLERGHERQPIHCSTCGTIFQARDACHDHILRMECERQSFCYDGITENQLRRLRENRRTFNEVERWYCLWEVMYPASPRPDSPYVGSPLEEMLSIVRRALQAARHNFPSGNPVAELLGSLAVTFGSSLPYSLVDLSGPISDTIEEHLLNWSYITSIIPDQDDLSFLTSDRSIIVSVEPASGLPLPSADGGSGNSDSSQQQPLLQSLQSIHAELVDDQTDDPSYTDSGSPDIHALPSLGSDLASFSNYSDAFDSPTLSLFDFAHTTSSDFMYLTSLLTETDTQSPGSMPALVEDKASPGQRPSDSENENPPQPE